MDAKLKQNEVRVIQKNEDEFSDESNYAFQLPQELFESKYPEMVEEFRGATGYFPKRKYNNFKQPKMTSHFKTVKQAISPAKKAEWSYRRAVPNFQKADQTCKPPDHQVGQTGQIIGQAVLHQHGHTEHNLNQAAEHLELGHQFDQAELHRRGHTKHQFNRAGEHLELGHQFDQAELDQREQSTHHLNQAAEQLELGHQFDQAELPQRGHTEHQFNQAKEQFVLGHQFSQAEHSLE